MCVNLWLTVRRSPAVEASNGLVPAE